MVNNSIRKKPVISGTISPLHKKKIDKLVELGEFASISDFLYQAVSEYLTKYDPEYLQFQSTRTELRNMIREELAEMQFEKTEK